MTNKCTNLFIPKNEQTKSNKQESGQKMDGYTEQVITNENVPLTNKLNLL